MYLSGLEVFLKKHAAKYRKQRLAFLCHPASVDKNLKHLSELVLQKKYRLNVTLFLGPQHGIRGEKQENMIESTDFIDHVTGLPVVSLYSDTREPEPHVLDRFDVLFVDLQDVGTRIYTYIYTMANCMRAAKRAGKKVVILDRPNPINGNTVEGNILEKEYTSFVGQYPIGLRHGMTIGELALMFNQKFAIGCDLDVIKMQGWRRSHYFNDLGRLWIPPSPNIPTQLSALIFPGGVFFEGTNISEGRGTTVPFSWYGAPFIDPQKLAGEMNKLELPGVYFRPIYFEPTYHKWRDELCGGVDVHPTNPKRFRPYDVGIHLLSKMAKLYPGSFRWRNPPYEYEYQKMPIDILAGSAKLRESIDLKPSPRAFLSQSEKQARKFKEMRKPYLLYR